MSTPPRTAVILAGGPISPASAFPGVMRPKLLLPIANRPLVDYQAAILLAAGVERLIISLDTNAAEAAERLEEHFRGARLYVECVLEKTPRGTGGSLKEIEDRLHGDAFWVVNGDLFLHADLQHFFAFHHEQHALATVGAVYIKQTPWEMERVEIDSDRNVKAIHRIHPAQNKRSMLRPAGLYLFEPEVLEFIPKGRHFDLKEQVFPRLIEAGTPARVCEIFGYCRMISSAADYLFVHRDVLLGQAISPEKGFPLVPETAASVRLDISPKVTLLDPCVIGSASRIRSGAIIVGPTTIGDQCDIGADAVLNECLVLANTKIGRGARLDRCIVGEGARIEDGTVLRDMIILAQPTKIGDLATPPGKYVALGSSGLMALPRQLEKIRRLYLLGKRGFDALVAAISLVMLAPLMLLIALAVKLDSSGEIIFRQRRCGRYGREFTMYKFRTMVAEAERLKQELAIRNEVDGPMFKMTADPRVTRVGHVLRAVNLDELPQLWNVLRGDMSLVGPRPLSMDEMRHDPRWRDLRLSVAPGLTGLWQIEAHTKTSFADWITYDIQYIRHMSPWLDVKIMFKTFLRCLSIGRGRVARGEASDHA